MILGWNYKISDTSGCFKSYVAIKQQKVIEFYYVFSYLRATYFHTKDERIIKYLINRKH